jgi:trimethylamine--corrinoid protein Co-methyltransferase
VKQADTNARPALKFFSTEQAERIHRASLTILERIGVHVYLPEAVELLRKSGAKADGELHVRIPRQLVEEALQAAPRSVAVTSREGEPAMLLEDGNSYFGTGPTIQYVYDVDTGQRRTTDRVDIEKAAQLCDYLPNLDFVMTMGMTGGVDPSSRGMNPKVTDRYDFASMLVSTTKPLMFSCWTLEGLQDIYDMGLVVRGSTEALQAKPFFINFRQPVSPLKHDAEPLRAVLYCAEKRIPMCYSSFPLMGATGPVTLAGAFALSNAEFLSGLVIGHIKRPGAPVIYSTGAGPMDMKTSMTPYNAPEAYLGEMACRAMSQYYRLPNFSYGGVADAKLLDEQAAAEAALSLFQAAVAGSTLIHDVGYMDSGMTACWELIVLGDEIIAHLRRMMKGMDLSDEHLALELMERVGPSGQFFMEDHTLEHYREIWYPKVFCREEYSAWAAKGCQPLRQILNEKVRWILANHKPRPLRPEVRSRIDAILKRAAATNPPGR